jgi:hypothetical protein
MPYYNNISLFQIDSVASSSTVNFGNCSNIRKTINRKVISPNFFIGDFTENIRAGKNVHIDPDLIDLYNLKQLILSNF